MFYGDDCFRPLSGKWGYRLDELAPVRDAFIAQFPSPLGEMGLSIITVFAVGFDSGCKFPSPLGEMGLSITKGMVN